MAESSTESGNKLKYMVETKVNVCVCSCSQQSTVQGLIDQINSDMSDVVDKVIFKTLPYNIGDMQNFDFRKMDVFLLCHSINNRRFSLTDVTDALYDRFLPKARRYVGKTKLGIIAHDFPNDSLTDDTLPSGMATFRNLQPATFENSSLTLMGGDLSKVPIDLSQSQLDELRNFFRFATSPPRKEVAEVYLRRRRCTLCLPCALCFWIRFCGCCFKKHNVGCLRYKAKDKDDDPPYSKEGDQV